MFQFQASFRVHHPDIDPAEITEALALSPHTSWETGDPRRSPNGAALDGLRRSSYWSYSIPVTGEIELPDLLDHFTAELEKHRPFLDRVNETGGRLEYFVGWFSEASSGEVFSSALMKRMSGLGIDLALDVYCK